jgi:hypothetical protein
VIWVAARYIIRSKVNESSTKQELIDCHIWIGEQQDSHWRSHLYEWLRYIKRNKRDTERQNAIEVKIQEEIKKFRSNTMNE